MMIRLSIILIVLAVCLAGRADVRDFRSWKIQKIELAKRDLARPVLALSRALSVKEQLGLYAYDRARSLTIADYINGYLSKQPDQNTLLEEISRRLSSAEMSELLLVYSREVMRRDVN